MPYFSREMIIHGLAHSREIIALHKSASLYDRAENLINTRNRTHELKTVDQVIEALKMGTNNFIAHAYIPYVLGKNCKVTKWLEGMLGTQTDGRGASELASPGAQ